MEYQAMLLEVGMFKKFVAELNSSKDLNILLAGAVSLFFFASGAFLGDYSTLPGVKCLVVHANGLNAMCQQGMKVSIVRNSGYPVAGETVIVWEQTDGGWSDQPSERRRETPVTISLYAMALVTQIGLVANGVRVHTRLKRRG